MKVIVKSYSKLALAIFFLVAFLFLVVMTIAINTRATNRSDWPTTNAIISDAIVIEFYKNRNIWPRYRHKVTYRYTVKENTYNSVCGIYGGKIIQDWGDRKLARATLPLPGFQKTIYYNPLNPRKCYRDIYTYTTTDIGFLVLIALFAFIPVTVMFAKAIRIKKSK